MGCCSSDLSETAGQGRALQTGDIAPDFTLENVDGAEVNAVEYARNQGQEYLVVAFYRGGWCPFCNGQIAKFSKKADAITKAGAATIFLSPSAHSKDAKKRAADPKEKLPFPTVQDKQNLVGKQYGVVHKSAPASALVNGVAKANSYVDPKTGETKKGEEEIPLPCCFLIRLVDMKILWSFGTDKAGMMSRPDPDDIIAELEAIKSGKTREVAPALPLAADSTPGGEVPYSTTSKVVIFSIENCPYCKKAKDLLSGKVDSSDSSKYRVVYLDGSEAVADSDSVQDAIVKKYDHETMPAVFINGEFIGGFSDVDAKNESGELDRMLA